MKSITSKMPHAAKAAQFMAQKQTIGKKKNGKITASKTSIQSRPAAPSPWVGAAKKA